MGGNYMGVGNMPRSSAEFNFYTDSESAHIVLTDSQCPITILPWEACKRGQLKIPMVSLNTLMPHYNTYITIVFAGMAPQSTWHRRTCFCSLSQSDWTINFRWGRTDMGTVWCACDCVSTLAGSHNQATEGASLHGRASRIAHQGADGGQPWLVVRTSQCDCGRAVGRRGLYESFPVDGGRSGRVLMKLKSVNWRIISADICIIREWDSSQFITHLLNLANRWMM